MTYIRHKITARKKKPMIRTNDLDELTLMIDIPDDINPVVGYRYCCIIFHVIFIFR